MSPNSAEDDDVPYAVVVNDEGEYSVWQAERPPPDGWHLEGHVGTHSDCLAHIERTWVDMTPRSLRTQSGDRAGQ